VDLASFLRKHRGQNIKIRGIDWIILNCAGRRVDYAKPQGAKRKSAAVGRWQPGQRRRGVNRLGGGCEPAMDQEETMLVDLVYYCCGGLVKVRRGMF